MSGDLRRTARPSLDAQIAFARHQAAQAQRLRSRRGGGNRAALAVAERREATAHAVLETLLALKAARRGARRTLADHHPTGA